jgi:hypothetical protein
MHVEHGVKLRDLQQVLHPFGEVAQLHLPPPLVTVVKADTSSPIPELSM